MVDSGLSVCRRASNNNSPGSDPLQSKKSSAGVEYEDQEIVELLTDFTRAPQTSVPLTFWRRNTEVMRSLERLLKATGEALLSLRRAAG